MDSIKKKIPYESKKFFLVKFELGGLRKYTNIIIVDQKIINTNQPVKKAI
tara:strand:+ start:35 stop:184 length:150 start_codon:yes stop_codon:yes gene_type:complete